MKTQVQILCLFLTLSSSFLNVSRADLPEGAFRGKSSLMEVSIFNKDVMALLLKKDPTSPGRYYAVLAEYTRITVTDTIIYQTAVTKWVPRLYAYRVDPIDGLNYSMSPLYVTASGNIDVRPGFKADSLKLADDGTLDGALLVRYEKNPHPDAIEETIRFNGKVGSTWEDYVEGSFFESHDNTGGDYLKKDINMELYSDQVGDFFSDGIKGKFQLVEKARGFFTFTPKSEGIQGAEKLVGKIGFFIDIVNWKPVFTTNELLVINPDDASDVGFYYQRHPGPHAKIAHPTQ